jgi:RNA polymerase sigma-70 factor (ECF subfamily)
LPRSATAIKLDDAALVEQAQQGDMAAFARLVTKYQDRVYNVCWRLCGQAEDARDLTQDAFIRALEAIQGFQARAGFYTWLYRIAVNVALSHRRKRRPQLQLARPDDPADVMIGSQADGLMRATGEAQGNDPVRRASQHENQALVQRALEELEDAHRTVVVLRDIEGLDYAEIADVLEVSPGTVKSRLHRARMVLREKLAPILGVDGSAI